jgi:mannan endo-1,4-beta-mannosidase
VTVPRTLVAVLAVLLPAYVYVVAPVVAGSGPRPAPPGPAPVAPRGVAAAGAPSPSVPTRTTRRTARPAAPRSRAPVLFPPRGSAFLGVSLTDPGPDLRAVDRFTAATGSRPSVVQFTRAWAGDRFDPAPFRAVAAAGAMPMLSWEPWDAALRTRAARELGDQPAYRLSRITAGAYDPYIATYAKGVKALGFPVAIRFAHEMNGFWYPWAEHSNGNAAGDYVRAHRHVRDVFRALGADDVVWVWSVNVSYPGSTPLRRLYPGDDAVGWVGISGYYGIVSADYVDFTGIFAQTLGQLRAFVHRPIVLTEVGATDAMGLKSRWVSSMFRALPRQRDVIGVVWFEAVKEEDWRLVSSPAAGAAFRRAARAPRYRVAWSRSAIPRTNL